MKAIKRQVEDEFQGEFGEDDAAEIETVKNEYTAENEAMVENEVELGAEEIVNVEEVINNVIDSVDETRRTLNDQHILIRNYNYNHYMGKRQIIMIIAHTKAVIFVPTYTGLI